MTPAYEAPAPSYKPTYAVPEPAYNAPAPVYNEPKPAYDALAPYHLAPAFHSAPAHKEVKLPPQPFAYEYGEADDYPKANFRKSETKDDECKVVGSYTIALPDGIIQTTTYTDDLCNGFVAEVTYVGTLIHLPVFISLR